MAASKGSVCKIILFDHLSGLPKSIWLDVYVAVVVAPLLYFRLLGCMGWIIRETIELPEVEEENEMD